MYLSQTPCQSALFINPSKGVKPPIPIINKSPASREVICTCGNVAARVISFVNACPSNNKGFNSPPPKGLTKFDIFTPFTFID